MEQENIGKLIKEIRTKNNLSQKEFATKFGVTYQAVSKWERGINLPDLSILKEICNEYNYSLDEFLNNKSNNTNKKLKLIIGIFIISLLVLIIILFIKSNNGFEFKKIVSNCNEFTVTGSIAYDNDKSSIYISHITYCGKEDTYKYKEITCSLYEVDGNKNIEIDNSIKKENITLEDFLKSVKFNIDDYKASCKKYKENSLYLEIDALNDDNKVISYKIPLTLEDNCN